MKKFLVAALSVLSISQAFADRRLPNEQRIPVDIDNATGTLLDNETLVLSSAVTNPRDAQIIICSLYAEGLAKKPGTTTSVEVKKFVRGMEIEVDQENMVNFEFRNANFGNGYKLSRSSLKTFASCQDKQQDDGSDGIGNCDPRVPSQSDKSRCDNTCRADKNNPTQCKKLPTGQDDVFTE